jgi:hypothetical protein
MSISSFKVGVLEIPPGPGLFPAEPIVELPIEIDPKRDSVNAT